MVDRHGSSPVDRISITKEWDPADHPRWPAGSSVGGEFRPKGIFGIAAPVLGAGLLQNLRIREDIPSWIEEIDFSNGAHGEAVDSMMRHLKRKKLIAVKEIKIRGLGRNIWLRGQPDIIAYDPEENMWVVVEVKTGKSPRLTRRQAAYLTLMEVGWHISSDDPRITALNLKPGTRLPPMMPAILWYREKGKPPELIFPPPPQFLP